MESSMEIATKRNKTAMDSSMEIATTDRGLLSHILMRLSGPQDMFSASMVCTAWYDVLAPAAQTLTISSRVRDSGFEAMTRVCSRLSTIKLLNCRSLSDDALNSLKNCENIQRLMLKAQFRLTPPGLVKLGECCPTLLKLSLELDPSVDYGQALRSLFTYCRHVDKLSLKN